LTNSYTPTNALRPPTEAACTNTPRQKNHMVSFCNLPSSPRH